MLGKDCVGLAPVPPLPGRTLDGPMASLDARSGGETLKHTRKRAKDCACRGRRRPSFTRSTRRVSQTPPLRPEPGRGRNPRAVRTDLRPSLKGPSKDYELAFFGVRTSRFAGTSTYRSTAAPRHSAAGMITGSSHTGSGKAAPGAPRGDVEDLRDQLTPTAH